MTAEISQISQKNVLPDGPEPMAAIGNRLKNYADHVAMVKAMGGVSPGIGTGTRAESAAELLQEDQSSHGAHRGYGPGNGSDRQVRASRDPPTETDGRQSSPQTGERVRYQCQMGNTESFRREKRESRENAVEKTPDIPEITVIEASPLPADETVFTLPGPAQTGETDQVDSGREGFGSTDTQIEALTEADKIREVTRPRNSKGSEHRFQSRQESDLEDEGQCDSLSLCGSDENSTPRGSRRHFLQVMMNTSPQVRRSMVLRRSVYQSSRSDSDSTSLVSSNLDEDSASVALDPLEHEWMMCASDGEWDSLHPLLTTEPSLVLRKDFVTGFTCLHWAAKHGKPELIAMIINFAKQHNVPISVDIRSNTGYTPLHIAAMHNHMDVVKLLVGAYNADVEVRDYSGRKACQYLTDSVSVDIRDIIGAYEESISEDSTHSGTGRWRFSKVLQSNLKPIRLSSPGDGESVEREGRFREKPVRRKSSLSRMKPKLQRLRLRTSQIVHSTSFHNPEDLDRSAGGSFKTRPKTHFFEQEKR